MRRLFCLVLALLVTADAALARETIGGSWAGSYNCAQGSTALDLVLQMQKGGMLRGLFHFHARADNPSVPEGCFEMTGSYDPAQRRLKLSAGRWLLRPPGFAPVDLQGRLGPDGETLDGEVIGPWCTRFMAKRISRGAGLPSACAAPGVPVAKR